MHSLKELYKIGNGPSSSHTMAPKKASLIFKERYFDADYIKVILYGSLAMTGKGHLTDFIIKKTLYPIECEVIEDFLNVPPHPNTMIFEAYREDKIFGTMTFFSVGGGSLEIEGETQPYLKNLYDLSTFYEIKRYCSQKNIRLYDYVYEREDSDFKEYLESIYTAMKHSIERGLNTEGIIHGDLGITRKANHLYNRELKNETKDIASKRKLCAYAYAVNEENACGGEVVTAPTCGASGTIPAVMRYMEETEQYSHEQIINALATAGLIGNLIKFNGSISGAQAGCQAEVGSACTMAAAFVSELNNLTIDQIEQSSEIALEHHLGLTCDPVRGYVQIPCIERNAVAAMRAIDASMLTTILTYDDSKISLDMVIKTMLETGRDIDNRYRETSEGGLAKFYGVGEVYERE